MNKLLNGVRVLDLTAYVSGPSATRMLADYGAVVIKVEALTGDQWRQFSIDVCLCGDDDNLTYDAFNLNKKSIAINMKAPQGMEAITRLLDTADVFVTNIRTKSLKKLGLDAETLTAKYPRLIYASIDGFGPKGPDAQAPSFDNYGFWVRSGFVRDMAFDGPDYYPVSTPSSVGDIAAGTNLVTGILAALYGREKSGKGEIITTSLYAAGIWSLNSMITRANPDYSAEQWPRDRVDARWPLARYYQCADGEWIFTQGIKDDMFPVVFEVLGAAEALAAIGVTDKGSMLEHGAECVKIFEAAFRARTADEWTREFRRIDIVGGKVPHFKDILKDEQAIANKYIQPYTCKKGTTFMVPCPPVHFASDPDELQPTAESVGQSTDEVLKSVGYTDEQLKEMRAAGAIK